MVRTFLDVLDENSTLKRLLHLTIPGVEASTFHPRAVSAYLFVAPTRMRRQISCLQICRYETWRPGTSALRSVRYESEAIAIRSGPFGPDDLLVWMRDQTASCTGSTARRIHRSYPERCACQQRVGGHPRWLEDRAGHDVAFLAKNVDTFIEAARKRPKLASVSFRLM